MSRPLSGRAWVAALIGLTGIAGCLSDGITTPDPNAPPAFAVIVSNPIALGSLPAAQLAPSLSTDGGDSIAFVSLAPGSIARGKELQIRNLASGFTRVDALVNGGLDPVPVPASLGDTLMVVATDSAGATQAVVFVMAAARRPVVVRTDPPPRKRDVPLNVAVVVVFSEPIDSASLRTGVLLRLGGVEIPGRIEFRDAAHLMVAFIPAASLMAETTYQLAVTRAVADLLGESLETPVTVEFTTATAPVAPHLEFIVHPTSTTAGAVISPAILVAIRDADGNTMTTATDNVTVATGDNPNGGTLSGTRTVAAVNGVATFGDLRLDRTSDGAPTGYTLTAAAAGFVGATSTSFRIAPSAAVALAFGYQPSNAIAALTLWNDVTVLALDAFGNAVPGFTGEITLTIGENPGGGSLAGTTTRTANFGETWFRDLRIDQPGSGYTLVASASGVVSASSGSFDIGPAIGPTSSLIAFEGYLGVSLVDASNGGLARLGSGGPSGGPRTFTWSPDGSRIALSGSGIHVMSTDGTGARWLTTGSAPAWSPDGSKIAFEDQRDGNLEIYVMNADGSGVTRLTNHAAVDHGPSWSPDGGKIGFASRRDGSYEIYAMNPDGSGLANLSNDPADDDGPVWSPDGTKIAFGSTRDGNREIYVMNGDGSGVTRLTVDPANDDGVRWSPDGTTLAFARWPDIYRVDADGTALTKLTSGMSAYGPSWSPDGTRIAFTGLDESDLLPWQIYATNADGSGITRLTPEVIYGDGCLGSGGCISWNNTSAVWRPTPRP